MGDDTAGERPIDLVRVRYVDGDGCEHVVRLEQAAGVSFEDGRMVRSIPSYRGQRHTPGRYWSATTGQLVEYESYLEAKWLTLLDFDPAVVAFATQPLEFDGVDDRGAWCHVPDVFARRVDGSGWLLDVKNPQRLGWPTVRLQAERTARVCQRLGWDYQIVGEPDAQRWANVSWLSGYRRVPNLGVELMPRLVGLAARPVPIGDLLGFMEYPDIAPGGVVPPVLAAADRVRSRRAAARDHPGRGCAGAGMRPPVRLTLGIWVGFEEQRHQVTGFVDGGWCGCARRPGLPS